MGADSRTCFGWLTITLILALLLVPLPVTSQITFERTYGGISDDAAYFVQQTRDGGYIIAGETESFGAGSQDVYLIKTDSLGDTVWTRTYGGPSRDCGESVQETHDGGYIIAGETSSFGAGSWDVYLIRTDSLGDTLWTRTYGETEEDFGYSVQETRDGGHIIAGRTWRYSEGSWNILLVKTDSAGDCMWTKTYGGIFADVARSVQQTQDGGYVIGGTSSFGPVPGDAYLIKTDSVGDTLWTGTYGGLGDDYGESARGTGDGGYIIVGRTESFGMGYSDVYLVKTDSVGRRVWTKSYGWILPDAGYSVQQTRDCGYVIAGQAHLLGAVSDDLYIIRTDPFGDSVWTRTYGGVHTDCGYSVQQTRDGGYIVAGRTSSFGAGSRDVYLVKTDSDGSPRTEDVVRPFLREGFVLFENEPNPFFESTLISYSLALTAHITLAIYDITGRMVETLVNETQQPGIHHVRWDRKSNPSGVYFCRLKACPEQSPEPGEGQSRRAGEFTDVKKMTLLR